MKKRATFRNFLVCMLGAALLSGCLTLEPRPAQTPEQLAAARAEFAKINWSGLTPFLNQNFINDNGDMLFLYRDPDKGRLILRVLENRLHQGTWGGYHDSKFEIAHTETPNVYVITAPWPGLLGRESTRVRLLEDGRFEKLDRGMPDLSLQMTLKGAKIGYKHIQPMDFHRDMYRLPDGRLIPVSYDGNSEYQKRRRQGVFGMWEDHVGKTYVGDGLIFKVGKDADGNLRLTYETLEDPRPGHYIITPPPNSRLLAVPEFKNPRAHLVALGSSDRLHLAYVDGDILMPDKGSFRMHFVPRGDRIYGQGHSERRGYKRVFISAIYEPVTKERILAAFEYRDRQRELAERRRQNAAEAARRREAMAQAMLSGFAEGLQSDSGRRLEQQSRQFERDLNRQLDRIERSNREREAARLASQYQARTPAPAPRPAPAPAVSTPAPQPAPKVAASGSATPAPSASGTAVAQGSPSTQPAQDRYVPNTTRPDCPTVDEGVLKGFGVGPTRSAAESNSRAWCSPDPVGARKAVSVNYDCVEKKQYAKVPVPGNPLKFTQEERPPIWECSVTYRCDRPKMVCSSGPGTGVRQ